MSVQSPTGSLSIRAEAPPAGAGPVLTGTAPDGAATTGGPPASISAQVARAGSWGLAGRSLLLVANFAATPFTVRLLGPAAYGLWALLVALFVTWAPLAEGGMSTATTKYGSECYAHGDAAGECTVIWSGLSFVLVTTSVVAISLAVAAPTLLTLLHVQRPLLGEGTGALRLLCAGFVLSALAGSVNTTQQVRLRWKQFTLLNTGSNLVLCVGVPIAIFVFSGGVMAAAAVSLLASALYVVGLSWAGARVQPALLHPRIGWGTVRRLVSYGGVLTLANFVGIPLLTAERFVLGHNASTTAVAYYAVAATVATTLCIIPEQLTAPLVPALARLESEGKVDEHRAVYGRSLSAVFFVVTPATAILALLARPFLTLWAGPAYGTHSTELLVVALVGVWAWAHGWVAKAYMLSAARVTALAWVHVVELPVYLGAAWIMTMRWGALGAAAVWSGRLVVDTVARFVIVHRAAHLPWLPRVTRRLRSLALPALLVVACLGVSALPDGQAGRAVGAAALFVGYCAALWWGVLTARERLRVAGLVVEVVGRPLPIPGVRPLPARDDVGWQSRDDAS